MSCQAGKPYSHKIRENSNNNEFIPWKWSDKAKSIDAMCDTGENRTLSPDNAYFSSGIPVKPNDKITIELGAPQDELGNNVYLCGFKTVIIEPTYFSLNRDTFQNRRGWNVRNPNSYDDIDIRLKNGDFLHISWGGKYKYQYNYATQKFNVQQGQLIIFPKNIAGISEWILPPGVLWEVEASFTKDGDGNPTDAQITKTPEEVYKHNAQYKWKGLLPRASGIIRKNVVFNGAPLDDNGSDQIKFDTFSYKGYLQKFSAQRTPLLLSYYDARFWSQMSGAPFSDNIGGYVVQVKWRECRHTQGELLKYTVAPMQKSNVTGEYEYDVSDLAKDNWDDVTFKDGAAEITISNEDKEGMLFFMIDNTDYKDKHSKAESIGQYKLIVSKEEANEKSALGGVLSDIVNYIRTIFIGDGHDKQGRVQIIFNNLVKDSTIIHAIRALLVFYIAFTGISFMIGISPITQQEGIIRLIKIAIVITLISPQSWEFFNTHLFQFFSGAAMELIARICTPFYDRYFPITNDATELTKNVFYMFDEPIKTLFTAQVWYKILSLFLTNLVGALFAIIIIASIVIFFICVIKATIIYIIAIITMSILFILAPLFISFILFKRTAQMFNYWIYQFIGVVLQPVLVFTAISLLFYVFKVALYASLSFAACKVCFLGFYVPIADWDICFIPGYIALYGGHFPPVSPFDAPLRMVAPVVCLIVIVQAMYVFTNFASEIANLIATQGYAGFDLAQASSGMDPISLVGKYKTAALGIIGMDKNTRAHRKGIKEKAKAKEQKEKAKEEGKEK